ncbi:RDD family protein [Flavobacterium rivuli]|uniref:RDD family protein n=1 Tax=Flavobacterium rivuli TaxID=498301 RepID=UPI00037D891A|nr:RDD family protein [Flavobacterium rivuli]
MPKKIIIVSIFISLLGIVAEILPTFDYQSAAVYKFAGYFTFIDLGNGTRILNEFNLHNYLNLFLYALLFSGGIFYAISRKETRLIRFVLSIIVLQRAIALFFGIMYLPFRQSSLQIDLWWVYFILGVAWDVAWMITFYKILNYFNTVKQPQIVPDPYDETRPGTLAITGSWMRLFHLITDTAIAYLMFWPILEMFIRNESLQFIPRLLEDAVGDRAGLWVVAVIARLIYYVLSEYFLQASPAKLLTETRIVNENGDKVALGTIFTRTFSRFVPFEALSFFGPSGWHDKWSGTYVINEKNEGAKGGMYFLIIPLFALIVLGCKYGANQYEEHKREAILHEKFEASVAEIRYALKNLTSDDIITLKLNSFSGRSQVFLKTEKTSTDKVTFTLIEMSTTDYNGSIAVENFYTQNKASLPQVTITKALLDKAISTDYEVYVNSYGYSVGREGKGGVKLLGNENLYTIKSVETHFMPIIKIEGMFNQSNYDNNSSISLQLINNGWKAYLTDIKNEGDSINWKVMLPATMAGAERFPSQLSIHGTGKNVEDIKVRLTFKDTLGRLQNYRVEMNGDNPGVSSIKKVK